MPAGTVVPGVGTCSSATGTPTSLSSATVSDTYWADFLFGTTNAYSLANYFVAHLHADDAEPVCAGRLEGDCRI